ncbi:MAG: DNA polymerase III subunit gamma/tau [Erysipelotrichaceae bacterium]|nr:DNA polymerase III subunit gamma/tau [Erysipelotrichaceae bacterium]
MAYQVLYRTYRPAKFSEVVGQKYIVKTLLNAIKKNRIAHAYLFAGPRGTGKTSVAKLFAKAINCENFEEEACDTCKNCLAYLEGNHPDIIELDAASNNGIDDIREIIEQVPYAPLLGKYKVYIIDEVHMLTTQAFNALLKTLEEPPAHVIFIFATTDPQKVIPTVLSRCQRYNFSKISGFEIKKRTIEILEKENIAFEEKAVDELARMAEGGMRDALSLLEQCLAYNPDALTLEDVEHIFGLTSVKEEVGLFIDVHNNRISDVVSKLRNMYVQGADTKRLAIDLLEIVKDALIYSDQGKDVLLNRLTATEAQEILKVTSVTELLKDAKDLEETLLKEKQNQNFLVYLELCLIRIAGRNKTEPEKIQITKEREEEKTEAEAIAVPEPDIIIEETEEIPVEPIIEYNIDFLLSILLDANRDLKINDQIIYNKLDLYRYEPDKRKFYQLLIGTELFASNKDAIIISGNKAQADNINTRSMNEELYFFLNEEFGIDKMVYGIDEAKKKQLIGLYKETPVERRNRPVYIEKYTKKAAANQTQEDKLRELFGDRVKVEE